MRCTMCGNEDLSKIVVTIEQKRVVSNTYKASDLKANDFKKPIELDHDPLRPTFDSIASAECTLCGNKFDQDELEELSQEINVSVF